MEQSLDELLATTPVLWTGAEFCRFARIARGTFYYRLGRGEIPYVRVAGQVRIVRDEIRALIASQLLAPGSTQIAFGDKEPSKEEQ